MPLTKTQDKVYRFIKRYNLNKGWSPTYGEIARYMGYRSNNAAYETVRAIAKKGYLTTRPGEMRGIVVL